MGVLGALLIVLATPLLIGYWLSNRKNPMWKRLGLLLVGAGVIIIVAGKLAGL